MSRVILEMEGKPYLRAIRKKFPRNRLLWLYGVATLASFTVFVLFWCTNIFRDAILSTLELRNGSTALLWWQRPPVPLVYKVYIFNYTNVQEFESGSASKLRVEEVGPYVYWEHLNRVNVDMHENHSLTYQEKRSFTWASGRPGDEVVVVPNIPLLGALAISRDMNFVVQLGLTAILTTIQAKPFINVPVGGYLWGYDDKIIEMAKPFVSFKEPFEKFGLLAPKCGVNSDRITMHTGEGDHSSLGMIQLINGVADRNIWGDKKCDQVYGTDGSVFPPDMLRDRNNPIYVYVKDICRSIPFRYEGRAITNGIPAYRYKLPADVFTFSKTKDSCYCAKPLEDESNEAANITRVCPPAGIFNTTVCNLGFPLLVSFPHFFNGDPSLHQHLDGLEPVAERHQSYLDMHPRLSIPIGGWSRFQMNVEVRKDSSMPLSGRLKDGMILPLIWIEIGMEEMPESVFRPLYSAHFLASAVEACCQWFSLIALVFLLFGFTSTLRKKQPIEHTYIPSVDSVVEQTKLPE